MTILSNATRSSWTEASSTNRSSVLPILALVWGGVIVTSVASMLNAPTSVPSVASLLARGMLLMCALLAMVLAGSAAWRVAPSETWSRMASSLPIAFGIAVIASWIGWWNDGSGGVAVSIRQALAFIGTAGLTDPGLGPDVILRFTILSLAILCAPRVREGISTGRRAIVGVTLWVAGATALLIPTWAANLFAVLKALPIAHAQDALRALGSLLANSYWSNFQADRFFAGIGNQLAITISLWSSGIALCILIGLLVVLARRAQAMHSLGALWSVVQKTIVTPMSAFAISAVAVGAITARGLDGLRTFDALPIVLLFLAGFSGAIVWAIHREGEAAMREGLGQIRDIAVMVLVLSAMLLGWPIMIVVLALVAFGHFAESFQPPANRHREMRAVVIACLMLGCIALGQLFAIRQPQLTTHVLLDALPWVVLAVAMSLALPDIANPSRLRRGLLIAVVGMMGFAAAMLLPVGAAIAALIGLALFSLQKRPLLLAKLLFPAMLVFAWLTTILKLMIHS